MRAKTYDYLEGLPPEIEASFGRLTSNHSGIIYGDSGNGKSSLVMQLAIALMPFGKLLYVGLEEGHSSTMQTNILRYIPEDVDTGIQFADHTMSYDDLITKLSKRNSPKFIVIDSVQYLPINKVQYQAFKARFPGKTFYFISHSEGKSPSGSLAKYIEYDVDVKIFVKGYVAFIRSRLKDGLPKPFVIWEDGAKKFYGKDFKKTIK